MEIATLLEYIVIITVAEPIFTWIKFKILKCGTDGLYSYNFDSQISILPKYLGGDNRATLSSAITNKVYYFFAEVFVRNAEGYEGRWMQRNWLHSVESDGQL
jgi:hypothetical protein